MKRRVVITGMGAITPLGHGVSELYQNQIEGKSGVAPITLFDASKFPTKFAAEVKLHQKTLHSSREYLRRS